MATPEPIHNAPPPVETDLLINGEWVSGAKRIAVYNPAKPDELVGTIVRATPAQVNQAIEAAKAAFPDWAKQTFKQRADTLAQALDRLEQYIDERTSLFVRENGKTFKQAKGELQGVPNRQRLTLELAEMLDRDRKLPSSNGRTYITHQAYGVVVSIVPWNAPNSLAFSQITAALLAGNAVVLKPPETCPLALIQSIKQFAEVLPPGTLNVVTGMPSEIGDTLTTHPDVKKIGFTGSIASARHIMANAANNIMGVTLELGGNDAAILLEDADLSPKTMERMASAVFRMAGQVCMAIKRIYVPQTIKDKFLENFMCAIEKIVVGDGLEPQVTMGPLHTQDALQRATDLIEDAKQRGAKVIKLGKIDDPKVFASGYFMQPTVVTDIRDDVPLMTEEQFCPAIPVTSYRNIDEAITRANNTVYGLGGSVWSKDIDGAMEVVRQLEAGTLWVNTHGTGSINRKAPYGGVKQSGIGRKGSLEGVEEYLELQTLSTYEGTE